MTDRNREFERSGGIGARNDERATNDGEPGNAGATGDRGGAGSSSLSRRHFLRNSAAVGAGAFALGGTGSAAGQSVVRERCGNNDAIDVGDGVVLNNDWSTHDESGTSDYCIREYDDGSYGWEWERGDTSACEEDCPDYPEVLIGAKPQNDDSNVDVLPEQRGNVEEWDVEIDVEMNRSDGEWNLALEWWLTEEPSPTQTITHEIMLILEKSDEHTKGGSIVEGAIVDDYGNEIDYWENPSHTDWKFHIFKIADNEVPPNVDLAAIQTYLDEEVQDDFRDELWVSGVEVGNETWDNTTGNTIVRDLDVRVNGQTATTGVDDVFEESTVDETPPTAPTNLTVQPLPDDGMEASWDPSTDEGGSGLAEYVVSVDGEEDTTVPAGTTTTELSGLTAWAAEFTVEVVAVDGAGNESDPATVTASGEPEPVGDNENAPTDPDDDGLYEDVNGNGDGDLADAVDLFQHREADAVTNHTDAYDFSGNDEIDLADVVQLFQENTS